MKKTKKTVLALCLTAILIVPSLVFSFECSDISSAKNIDVKVCASAEKTTNDFKYDYMLASSQKSVQEVSDFMVEFYSPISNTLAPKGWFGMGTGLTGGSPFAWGALEENIKHSESLAGFSMQSEGLPAIVTYYARGWVEMPVVSEAEAPDKPCPEQNIFIDAVKGKTLGPKDPPADFKPIDFLNYIIGLKHQASSLGWITNKGTENSLNQKLDNAKKKLEQGNIIPAKNILNAFINEVEAQNGKHLTSEAYGLLKYNVLYLIEKLK